MMNWIWLGAMIVFGILEAATAGLVSIWFVCGSVAALLATFLGAALWLQVVLFLSVSAITLAATRPMPEPAQCMWTAKHGPPAAATAPRSPWAPRSLWTVWRA